MEKFQEFITSLKKCLTPGSSPSLDEFSNFALIFKQLIAVVLGLTFAIIQFTGLPAMLAFLVVSNLGLVLYSKRVLEIDEETIENHKMFAESLFPSFVLFILVWTITHTFLVVPVK